MTPKEKTNEEIIEKEMIKGEVEFILNEGEKQAKQNMELKERQLMKNILIEYGFRKFKEGQKAQQKKTDSEVKEKDKHFIQLTPCHKGTFNEIECLESETQFGFMKNDYDRRPAWHLWINKEDAVILFKLFTKQQLENKSKEELEFLKDIRNKYFSDLDSITGDKDVYDYLDEVRMELDNKIKNLGLNNLSNLDSKKDNHTPDKSKVGKPKVEKPPVDSEISPVGHYNSESKIFEDETRKIVVSKEEIVLKLIIGGELKSCIIFADSIPLLLDAVNYYQEKWE
jgi:hypothetical protein